MADWAALKSEYATTQISYRKLAKKAGVPYRTLAQRARDEDWVGARNQYCAKTVTKAINQASSRAAERAAKIQTAADKLLDKVIVIIDDPESMISTDTRSMRDVSMVLKDLKEIQNIRSDIDLREQEARIAKLQREAEKDDMKNEPIEVIIESDLEEYTN